MSGTRFGTQPAKALLRRKISATARDLGVSPGALAAWLDGRNVAPAEIKLGVADALGLPPEDCWTPDAFAAAYAGARR